MVVAPERYQRNVVYLNERRSQVSGVTSIAIVVAAFLCTFFVLSILAWKINFSRDRRGSLSSEKRKTTVQSAGSRDAADAEQGTKPDPLPQSLNLQPNADQAPESSPPSESVPDAEPVQKRSKSLLNSSLSKLSIPSDLENGDGLKSETTPPPAYASYRPFRSSSPQPSIPVVSQVPLPPPSPTVIRTGLTVMIVPLSESIIPSTRPSPPSSPDSSSPKVGTARSSMDRFSPRQMTVIDDFLPTLPDELAVSVGDVVQLLDEYADGWCLIRRTGLSDVKKGVIPRFCLQDPPEVIPVERGLSSAVAGSSRSGHR